MLFRSGETTVMRMVTAYATIANGGRKINATLIDRIQDRFGRTIYQHDQRECVGCEAAEWTGQAEPELVNIQAVDSTIAIELRYAGSRNVAQRPLYPAAMPALVRPSVAAKLLAAQSYLQVRGFRLKIWDARIGRASCRERV